MLDGVFLSLQVYSISYSRRLTLMDNIHLVPSLSGMPLGGTIRRLERRRMRYFVITPHYFLQECILAEAAFLNCRL